MDQIHIFDVAVIGAGPTGSYAAEYMAQQGLSIVLLEKDKTPGDSTVCAGGMHEDVVKFASLSEEIIEKSICKVHYLDNGSTHKVAFKKKIHMINRQRLDRELAQRAQQAGVQLMTSARVVSVAPKNQFLKYVQLDSNEEKCLKAKVFVFADGPYSLINKIFAIDDGPKKIFSCGGVEYELELADNVMDRIDIVTNCQQLPFGYYWVFPKKNHLNVGVGGIGQGSSKDLWKLLNQFIEQREDLKSLKVIQRKGGIIPLTVNKILQRENCLAIGDAAGMVNPLTGGGYVCGFLSARIAAEACIKAFDEQDFYQERLKYAVRLQRDWHYMAIQLGHHVLKFHLFFYQKTKISLYSLFLNLYFYIVSGVMRFVKVI